MGKPATRVKGSFLVEVLLWLLFCAPGIVYTAWRLTSRERVCGSCGGHTIPVTTPRGQQLMAHYGLR